MLRKLNALLTLCWLMLGMGAAQAQTAVLQSQTTQNLAFGPVVAASDHNTALTGLIAPAPSAITATGGSATTITTATLAVAGQTVQFGASTTTTALRGLTYVITSVAGTGPYTLTMPTMAGTPVSTDTYQVYNTAGASPSTTSIISQVSAVVGQWIQFSSFSTTTALRGTGAWITAVSGTGPYTLTLAPALGATPVSTDTYVLSNIAVQISKNGGAFGTPVGAITESGYGWYALAGNATDEGTLGLINLHWSVLGSTAGDANERAVANVVSYNPLSATNLGLTALPTSAPNASGGLHTVGTGAGQIQPDGTGAVPVALGQTLPTSPTANTTGQALFYASQKVGRMGTAQAGTVSTITLDAGASAVDNIYASHGIRLSGGTGAGQFATIVSYVGSTKVATITRPGTGQWTTTPDSTSVFWIEPVPYSTLTPGEHTAIGNDVVAGLNLAAPGSITASSAYAKLNAASSAGDPWSTALPGSYASGTAGYILGHQAAGSDPWATLLTSETTTGSFGAFVKTLMTAGNVTVGGYASGQDPATLLLANSRFQKMEAVETGAYTRTGNVFTFTKFDGSTFTLTLSALSSPTSRTSP